MPQPLFEEAVRIAPEDYDALLRCALALARLQRPDCAAYFERCLAVNPSSYDAHFRFAQVCACYNDVWADRVRTGSGWISAEMIVRRPSMHASRAD